MIDIWHLTKEFSPPFSLKTVLRRKTDHCRPTRALDNVSFNLEKGKLLAVLGPNGAGKTTLLKIIATLIVPDRGTVTVNGYPLGKNDRAIQSTAGISFSCERSFYWRLTGRQNLEFFARLYGLSTRQIRLRLAELFTTFGVDYEGRRFDSYSTGMQQTFSIMRALLHDPAVLLLDEPTKSLDYQTAQRLRQFIREELVARQGKTVLFTTHQVEEACEHADTFLILHRGRLASYGRLTDLQRAAALPQATLSEIYLRLTTP